MHPIAGVVLATSLAALLPLPAFAQEAPAAFDETAWSPREPWLPFTTFAAQEQPVPTTAEVVVTASPALKEEKLVGPYRQPAWTTHRRFPSTRVYLQTQPGEAEFEQWIEVREPKHGETETRLREEFAFGLGSRLQLDLYVNTEHIRQGTESTFDFRGWSAELRYALADWGEIPANPTLYFEYHFQNGDADKIEPKLLLGGELGYGWHWGSNLIYERTLTVEENRTEEIAATMALGYTLVDERLSLGPAVSVSYESEHEAGAASAHTTEVLIGPSLQFIPVPRAHLNIEPLFGVTDESKRMKLFIVFGWQF